MSVLSGSPLRLFLLLLYKMLIFYVLSSNKWQYSHNTCVMLYLDGWSVGYGTLSDHQYYINSIF